MRPSWIPSAAAATALSLASLARADDRAIAQQAFEEGRSLMAAGRVAEACPKFAAAAQLSRTAGVRLNLAECYAKLGRLASAWVQAEDALTIAERAGDAAAADLARAQMVGLKPRLAYMTISAERQSAVAGMEVALDGAKIPDALWGSDFPVDPGEHVVSARAAGYRPWSARWIVTEAGAHLGVSVPELVPEGQSDSGRPEPGSQGSLPRARTTDRGGPEGGAEGRTARTLALVSGGLGVVGFGIAIGFAADALSKKSQYESHESNGQCSDPQCRTISQNAVTSATASTVASIAGGALAAVGIVLWVTAPPDDARKRAIAVTPIGSGHEVGVGVLGRW
ncbi:MAG: tetratricopeptide repeat protein [Polyangiaceae bacterium]|jgi:hypothetical protein